MRCIKEECEAARGGFREAERIIKSAQQSWRIEEDRLRNDAMNRICGEFDALENEYASHAAHIPRHGAEVCPKVPGIDDLSRSLTYMCSCIESRTLDKSMSFLKTERSAKISKRATVYRTPGRGSFGM